MPDSYNQHWLCRTLSRLVRAPAFFRQWPGQTSALPELGRAGIITRRMLCPPLLPSANDGFAPPADSKLADPAALSSDVTPRHVTRYPIHMRRRPSTTWRQARR